MDRLLSDILSGAQPDLEEVRAAWLGTFDFLDRLGATPQDPVWHGEGDVFTHTSMVLQETYREIEEAANTLTIHDRAALVLGAIFHDIAKCVATRERPDSEGRIRIVAPRHADRGRSYIVLRLLELGLRGPLLRDVLGLVGHHHDPRKLVDDGAPPNRYRKLARLVDPRLVYHLERADLRGRICQDLEHQLELIELFRLGCEEARAWTSRTPFQGEVSTVLSSSSVPESLVRDVAAFALRDLENGVIFSGEEAISRSYAFRERPSKLTLLVGPSGSGKSTSIEGSQGMACEVISLDTLREKHHGARSHQKAAGEIVQEAKELLRESLRAGTHAIWDATNLKRDRRRALIGLARDYGAATRIVAFAQPLGTLHERNGTREHPVPAEILSKQIDSMDWPYAHEADVLEIVDPDGIRSEPWRGFSG